jgi:GNAT superfamily N-acetyltransferase
MHSESGAMNKTVVFISHIAEEKEIAQGLKKLVETAFLNMVEVFVSSDPSSVGIGSRWLEEITCALKKTEVLIILASPDSVKRPWINFESGSGWTRDIPVIPLCHSGMTPATLPAPLSFLQAAIATEEKQLEAIFSRLATARGSMRPQLDYSPFIDIVKEFESSTLQHAEVSAQSAIPGTAGLSAHELATLVEIAGQTFSSGGKVDVFYVRESVRKAGYRKAAVSLALKMLERKGFVEISQESDWRHHDEYTAVRITERGWQWLEANHDKLSLKIDSGDLSAPSDQPASDDVPF